LEPLNFREFRGSQRISQGVIRTFHTFWGKSPWYTSSGYVGWTTSFFVKRETKHFTFFTVFPHREPLFGNQKPWVAFPETRGSPWVAQEPEIWVSHRIFPGGNVYSTTLEKRGVYRPAPGEYYFGDPLEIFSKMLFITTGSDLGPPDLGACGAQTLFSKNRGPMGATLGGPPTGTIYNFHGERGFLVGAPQRGPRKTPHYFLGGREDVVSQLSVEAARNKRFTPGGRQAFKRTSF